MIAWYAALVLAYYACRSSVVSAIKERMGAFQKLGMPLQIANPRFQLRNPILLALPIFVLSAVIWMSALSEPDPRLHVYFVDVGQGDAIFIVTPSGHQVLIDGGPDPQAIVQFLGQHMPPGTGPSILPC